MQRRVTVNPLIQQIQMVFYNDLANLVYKLDHITEENIDKLIQTQLYESIIHILEISHHNHHSISLPTGYQINSDNCPTIYLSFFETLLKLLKLKQQNNLEALCQGILQFESKLTEQFSAKIAETKQFILEAKGLKPIIPDFIKPTDSIITSELIRKTFYNEMVSQTLFAIENAWITLAELEDQEPFIFLALPALTLIEALYQSRNTAGIRLLDNKILTEQNCPLDENFRELFIPIIAKKAEMTALSDNELIAIKCLCLNKDMEFPAHLVSFKSPRVIKCAAAVNQVASLISQRGVFQRTITDVMKFCMDSLKTHAPKPSL